MKTIYLIRHTDGATAQGRAEAMALAEKLPRPAKLYTSELAPALQTAQAICDKWHVRPESLACMNELPYDEEPEAPALAPPMMMGMGSFAPKAPEPEKKPFSFEDLNAGVETFIKQARKFPHRTTCVVHPVWLNLLLWRLIGFRADTVADKEAFHRWQATLPDTAIWYLHIGDSWEIWMQATDLDALKSA